MVGFCAAEAYPGPFHTKLDPGNELAYNNKFWFTQTVVPEAERVGVGFTTTVVLAEAVQLFSAVTVTSYTPACKVFTLVTNGFC